MFKRNEGYKQATMFGSDMQMSEKRRRRLEASWADTFYHQFFCRIDESIFAPLISRPTGIRGSAAQGLSRDAFDSEVEKTATPLAVTCPGGQRVELEFGRRAHNLVARFDIPMCDQCPLREQCPTAGQLQCALRLNHVAVHLRGVWPLADMAAECRGAQKFDNLTPAVAKVLRGRSRDVQHRFAAFMPTMA